MAVPLVLICGFVGYVFTDTQGFGWGTIICLVLAGWFMNCAKEAGRYRAWRREWDALDPDRRPRRPLRKTAGDAVALIGGAALLWLLINFNNPNSSAHLIAPLLVVVIVLLAVVKLVGRLRKPRRPTSQDWIVTQAASRPLPAPSVAEAYARLPDYCRSLFPSEPARKEQS